MEPPPYGDQGYHDPQGSFSDTRIRHGFIRKTYSIISLQLLLTTAITVAIMFIEDVKMWFHTNVWFLYVCMACTFVIVLVLACCESVARSYPVNMILLILFTIFESFLVGTISSVYDTETVLIAVGITAVVVIAITIFAFQTKYDFTGMGTYLFVFSIVLLAFGFLTIFLHSKILNLVYAALGAVLFSFYLVFDTQLMLGGKHKYSISPEDYIMAALNLYIDIIQLFLMILRLVGAARD